MTPRCPCPLRRLLLACAFLCVAFHGRATHAADPITLEEPATDFRVRDVAIEVRTSGKVHTSAGNGKTNDLDLQAMAAFRFTERRLPPGGRDAQSLRALRHYQLATLQSRVGEHDSGTQLPEPLKLVVARGGRSGVQSYCPQRPMSRETADLLEVPTDPLVLTALLPRTAVAPGGEWRPAEWATQMLATIDAVEKSDMTCRLVAADDRVARIEFFGQVTGQRFGANTDVVLRGELEFDRGRQLIRSASAKYTLKASIGTINPGIDATVDITLSRELASSPGRLTDAVAEAVPLEPAPGDLMLAFEAAPWGVRLAHDRRWYVFQALLEGTPKVVILRLMEQGSLICQCNISPIASASPGQSTPLDKFESDIRQALGERFKRIVSRERIPTDDGRVLLRVVTEGEMTVSGEQSTTTLPMNWIYYLCADRSGKQVSFVYVIEPAYMELLAGRDVAMVASLRFDP